MKNFRDWVVESKGVDTGKYKKGDFGYWWTVEQGKEDIEGQVYRGDINAKNAGLVSLKGSPKEVSGGFDVSENKGLKTLVGGPEIVGGLYTAKKCNLADCIGAPRRCLYFVVSHNNITSLRGCHGMDVDSFDCQHNKIRTLKDAPIKVGSLFDCSSNVLTDLTGFPLFTFTNAIAEVSSNKLKTLNGIQNDVVYMLIASYNELEDLYGAPSHIKGDLHITHNKLKTLAGDVKKVDGYMLVTHNPTLKSLDGAPEVKGKFISDL